MIDIHPPAHGAMTRRDFFVHLFIVVLGILIAIGLEQSVEYLHHHHLATEARRALLSERDSNENSNNLNIFATQRHQQDLRHDLAVLEALRTHQPLPPGPFIVQHVTYLYLDDEWRKIHETGTINYLHDRNLNAINYRYQIQNRFMDRLNRSNEDLNSAASVLRSAVDPPNNSFEREMAFSNFLKRFVAAHESLPQQEVDAAWTSQTEPGNVAALSPAQIDSLQRALQKGLADDDTMLRYCFHIKRNLANNPEQ